MHLLIEAGARTDRLKAGDGSKVRPSSGLRAELDHVLGRRPGGLKPSSSRTQEGSVLRTRPTEDAEMRRLQAAGSLDFAQ